MKDSFDGLETAIKFIGANEDFIKSLGTTFPDEDIVEESSFSGMEIVTIFGKWTHSFVEKVAAFLIEKKKTEAAQEVWIKIGENEIKLKGFGGEDVDSMKQSINELVQQLRET
ncbi:MAG: hypothetical protein ACRESZ_17925 [Methylococcales bacterium]